MNFLWRLLATLVLWAAWAGCAKIAQLTLDSADLFVLGAAAYAAVCTWFDE